MDIGTVPGDTAKMLKNQPSSVRSARKHCTNPTKGFAPIDAPSNIVIGDNSGEKPTLTMNKNAQFKVYANTPQMLTLTATDATGNNKSCTIEYIVEDNEAPQVLTCPKGFTVHAGRIPVKVFWPQHPRFHDNVDKTNIRISSTVVEGSNFYRGRTEVTYEAKDQRLNVAKCSFAVQVEMKKCKYFPAPKNGALLCHLRKDGKAETYVCTVSCKKGFWFSEKVTRHYTYYVCGENVQWQGQDTYDPFDPSGNTFFDILEEGKSPWPNCSPSSPPKSLKLDFKVFGKRCLDISQQETLKRQFVKEMKADMMINAMFCSGASCDANDIVVQCATTAFFYAVQGTPIVTTFLLKLKNNFQNATQNYAALHSMERIGINEFEKVAPSKFKVRVEAEFICKLGYELLKVANNTINKCVQCPEGSYFHPFHKSCRVCATGHYQPKAGQLRCLVCPPNSSASGTLAKNHVACQTAV